MTSRHRTSILCPNCRKLISAGLKACPHCGLQRPGSWWKNNFLTRGADQAERLIKMIIYVNIGMYVISLLLSSGPAGFSFNPLAFLAPDQKSLLLLGATGTLPIDGLHRWWSLIAANYLHGNLLHILFNMIALRQIAPLVDREYGVYRLFSIYSIGGGLGFLVSYLAGVPFTIGASAAICSLIGAALYYGKSRGGTYGQAVYSQMSGWVVGLFLFGLLVPGINNWGHGGGIGAGILLGFLLGYHERRPERFSHKTMAGGCLILTAVVLAWAVATGLVYQVAGR